MAIWWKVWIIWLSRQWQLCKWKHIFCCPIFCVVSSTRSFILSKFETSVDTCTQLTGPWACEKQFLGYQYLLVIVVYTMQQSFLWPTVCFIARILLTSVSRWHICIDWIGPCIGMIFLGIRLIFIHNLKYWQHTCLGKELIMPC